MTRIENIEYRMSNVECRSPDFCLQYSIFDILQFLFILLTMVVATPAHLASGETASDDGFRQMLVLAGLDDDKLARFVDGDPFSKDDLPVVLSLLFRLQQPGREQLDRWTQRQPPLEAWLADPIAHQAELAWFEGHFLFFEKMPLPAELAKVHQFPQLYRCKIELHQGRGICEVIVPRVPRSWLAADTSREPVRFRGLFLKTVPRNKDGDQATQIPLLLTPHLAWFPDEGAPPGQLLLAAHGMDVALLDEVKHRQPFVKSNVSREGKAFYACLTAARKAGQGELSAKAKEQLPLVAKHWRAEHQAATNDRQALLEQLATATEEQRKTELGQRLKVLRRREQLAAAVIGQAAEGRFSVAPLFLQPEKQVGRLMVVEGIARRAVRIAGEDASVRSSYYEIEVFTADSENLPVVCCVVDVPAEFPLGDSIRVPVRVAGLFFKSWLYRTRTARQQRHYAPIVIGAQVERLPTARVSNSRWGFGAGIAVLILLAALWSRFAWNERQDRRRRLRLRHSPNRQQVASNPFPWYSPRFWHGMRLVTWLRQLGRHRLAISPSRIPMALGVTMLSAANSGLAGIDHLIYSRRISKVKLAEPPLFILGHWRSGTTFLHELLICDPAHTYPTTYQCFVPHHFVFSESWFAPLSSYLLPRRRPMDNMTTGWQRPQEDEFALSNMGVRSPYLSMMFPNDGPQYSEYLDLHDLSPADREHWKAALQLFFQRLTFRNNRRLVVKSPPHTARVRTLLEMFPEARFVHIVRNPYTIYASTLRLWNSLHEAQAFQMSRKDEWLPEYVLSSFERMIAAFEGDRSLLAENQLVELRYEDLVADPKGQLMQIYDRLQLGDFSRAAEAIDIHLAEVKDYRPNQFDLDPATRHIVRERWAGYFERYGYDGGNDGG